jgi:uncharacterized protein (TIGR03437 family)
MLDPFDPGQHGNRTDHRSNRPVPTHSPGSSLEPHDRMAALNVFLKRTQMRLQLRHLIVAFAAVGFACPSLLSQNVISTAAGTEWVFPDDGKSAISAPVGRVINVAVDPSGNVLIADVDNFMVFRLTTDGIIHILAGNGIRGLSGDGGPALQASLRLARGMVHDRDGNLYIAFSDDHRVRKIAPDGTITAVAGGSAGFSGDGGPALQAQLNAPDGLAIDGGGNLYIADTKNHRIRKVSPSGIITTVAGNGVPGFAGDNGAALNASLNSPAGLAVDAAGNLFIADAFNNRVRKLSPDGKITTLAGDGTQGFHGDGGPAVNAALYQPTGVALDPDGQLYVADAGNHRIRIVTSNGIIRTVAGTGEFAFGGDGGPAVAAKLNFPTGVVLDKSGNLYIADYTNARVRRINPAGTITTVAGSGTFRLSPDGLQAQSTVLHLPTGIVLDSTGSLYIAENQRARVRKVSPKGIVSTVAGNGQQGFSGENVSATLPALQSPSRLAMDSAGNLYISDNAIHRIRRVTPGGLISTVAGSGNIGFAGDGGPATSAYLNQPEGVAVDSAGNIYIADLLNHRVRKVDSTGVISTFAGNGVQGFSGDNGPATSASLNSPTGLAVDGAGNVWIAERYNHRIRKVTAGIITTVAGNGTAASTGDGGPAVQASLNQPAGVAVDSGGNIYIAELFGSRIRRVTPSGIITTIAGTGVADFLGDGGPATNAALNIPSDVKLDPSGNVYVADAFNNRVRVVLAASPSLQVVPAVLSFSADSGGGLSEPQVINISSSLAGVPLSISTNTKDGGSWLSVSASSGSTPAGLQVSVDASQLSPGNYAGNIAVTAPGATPPALTIAVTVTVSAAVPGKLALSNPSIEFSLTQGTNGASKQVSVLNQGGGSVEFSIRASTSTGGSWLQVTPDHGIVTPASPASLTIAATPGSLGAGTYSGTIVVNRPSANETITMPVTMAVNAIQQRILLSQTGLTFIAAMQGGSPLPQAFGILNTGQGSMNWNARASTLSGGSWLGIDQTGGTVATPFTDVSLVNVSINPAGLTAGDYYGQIQVTAPGAPNSPQIVSVVLNVLPLGSNPGPEVRPTGLIFIGQSGNNPGSQNVLVSNPITLDLTFGSSRTTIPSGGNWFVHLPTDATVRPNAPVQIVVQPDFTSLEAGKTYRGFLNLGFQDGTSRTINILSIVAPTGGTATSANVGPRAVGGCSPTSLLVQPTSLTDPSTSVALLQPTTLQARVVDNCGAPITSTSGAVTATFSSADSQVNLVHVGNGTWSGTWQPRNGSQTRVTVQFAAFSVRGESVAAGTAALTVSLRSGAATPLTFGAANSASGVGTYISPGGLVSIFGQQLADTTGQPDTIPFPTQLNGTQVLMGGKPLPLRFVGSGQVNAQVPFELGINSQQQLLVQRGTTLSVPQDVVVAAAQPAVYTQDQSGKGAGVIVNGITNALITSNNPVKVGDVIVIYCNGLGAVIPPVPSGAPAPPNGPLSRTQNPLTVTIGGVPARVDFAGLAPGYPDLYQVNAVVPAGLAPGDNVPVVLNIAAQSSPPVTISVR